MKKSENLKMKVQREKIEKRLLSAVNNKGKFLRTVNTDIDGLSSEVIENNRELYGNNKIVHGKRLSFLKKITKAFINPFTSILIFLALISSFTDIIIPIYQNSPDDVDPTSVIIILTMVIISGLLRYVQESRSGAAASKLLEMISTTATVERKETGLAEIPIDDIVVGDIVHLSAGDMIPADVCLLQAKDLFISQSVLTGESEPVEKFVVEQPGKKGSMTEYEDLVFMGCNVLSGTAKAVVVTTGNDTLFGTMAQAVVKKPAITSFEKGVNSVSWVLIRFMLVMVPVIFFINVFTKGSWFDAFLFGISVAVGLTPEMLPMIVTTCLAKGAVSMSKEKTIIKNLNSIQNFGAMDILCTDKTGTLTQNRVVLEYHLNVQGQEDVRVLRHAFLNSYFQTGLKNLMDIAIINRMDEEAKKDDHLQNYPGQYIKVDEIPFDFTRRRMSVVVEDQEKKRQIITKGAVEEMLSICSYVEYDGNVSEITAELRNKIKKTVKKLNLDGMRVLAVAQKTNPAPVGEFSVKDECNMVLIGYLAFFDPPKESSFNAIKSLWECGVETKILTGDNPETTSCICKQVGIETKNLLLGSDIDGMTDEQLNRAVEKSNVFAKLSPEQKARIVTALRVNGHTVGFMGDGINDAAAMRASDVGISVNEAVDIAKEAADVILLEKDLMILQKGIIEGRKTYANMIKYIKMTASSNFGNVFSVVIASMFLPFLPMESLHLILLNLTYDLSCTSIPWDNVDKEFLRVPRKWDASFVKSFMLWFGPTSSVFDITTYLFMYFIVCPMIVSNGLLYSAIPESDTAMRALYVAVFQAGWFIESMWTQTLVIHMLRTPKIPFLQSRASFPVITLTSIGIAVLSYIPYTSFGADIGLAPLNSIYWTILLGMVAVYMFLVTVVKKMYIKRYGTFY
ncbi:magnesium-translocating P-type ATPase [Pectinatus frisingensis]|uniref:magnesium-translocating P-type ATPase n=1 Tax=Pectinatus frisingensis TaxID=865 RepID=UPI0018C81B02|nr:magnesium-translocating P-type ATPase [Pectinatus frisingensis]